MVSSLSFPAPVARHGIQGRKHIEIPKTIRDFVPLGNYQVTISAMGTIDKINSVATE